MQHSAYLVPPRASSLVKRVRRLLLFICTLLALGALVCMAQPAALLLLAPLRRAPYLGPVLLQLAPPVALSPHPAPPVDPWTLPDPAHLWMGYALAVLAALYARATAHPRSSQALLRVSIVSSTVALGLAAVCALRSAAVPWILTSLLSLVILTVSTLCLHYLHLLRRLSTTRRRLPSRMPFLGTTHP